VVRLAAEGLTATGIRFGGRFGIYVNWQVQLIFQRRRLVRHANFTKINPRIGGIVNSSPRGSMTSLLSYSTRLVSNNVGMTGLVAKSQQARSHLPAYGMAALLIGSGVGHFAVPARFDEAMPTQLPGDVRTYTLASGVVEVVLGVLLVLRRTRRLGALATAVFFILIAPAIANQVRLASGKGALLTGVAVARLPLHVVLIRQAVKISRNA
jgi:uncharacterized membrane protein